MINKNLLIQNRIKILCLSVMFVLVSLVLTGCQENNNNAELPEVPEQIETIAEQSQINVPDDVPGAVGNVIDIDVVDDKMVSISLESVGRANPFVPANDLSASKISKNDLPKFDILEPPMSSDTDSDASKIVTTKISGIMFDKYNPSAILNIENTDYLVRSGDVINGYKILAISPQTVTVQLGSNVYKAGVGEVVANDGIIYNEVSNLSRKFGGAGNKKK